MDTFESLLNVAAQTDDPALLQDIAEYMYLLAELIGEGEELEAISVRLDQFLTVRGRISEEVWDHRVVGRQRTN